jgi:hypothetical protein
MALRSTASLLRRAPLACPRPLAALHRGTGLATWSGHTAVPVAPAPARSLATSTKSEAVLAANRALLARRAWTKSASPYDCIF